MKIRFIIILLFSVVIGSQSKVGTTSAQFLGIGVGARPMSMAGAFTSMIGDPSSLYWNPASVSKVSNSQISILNTNWLVDTQWYYLLMDVQEH